MTDREECRSESCIRSSGATSAAQKAAGHKISLFVMMGGLGRVDTKVEAKIGMFFGKICRIILSLSSIQNLKYILFSTQKFHF